MRAFINRTINVGGYKLEITASGTVYQVVKSGNRRLKVQKYSGGYFVRTTDGTIIKLGAGEDGKLEGVITPFDFDKKKNEEEQKENGTGSM